MKDKDTLEIGGKVFVIVKPGLRRKEDTIEISFKYLTSEISLPKYRGDCPLFLCLKMGSSSFSAEREFYGFELDSLISFLKRAQRAYNSRVRQQQAEHDAEVGEYRKYVRKLMRDGEADSIIDFEKWKEERDHE